MSTYEKYQLQLIVAQYAGQGYTVAVEEAISGMNFRFDAVARHADTGRVVVIELVSSALHAHHWERRAEAFRQLAAVAPNVEVDFRFVDAQANQALGRSRIEDVTPDIGWIPDLLNYRLLAPNVREAYRPSKYLELWGRHVLLIRSYFRTIRPEPALDDVLEIYNELLRGGILIAPEERIDGLDENFVDLHGIALAATQGVAVSERSLRQLYLHIREVRRQLKLGPGKAIEIPQ